MRVVRHFYEMANIITNNLVDKNQYLQMSNGGTSVFISLLSLAASESANSLSEIKFSICISSSDQGICGRGCVGFDISDLPWSSDTIIFVQQKDFLRAIIKVALSQKNWHKLNYKPDIEMAINNQMRFMEMIESFNLENITNFDADNFLLPNELGEKCAIHGVFLHRFGCVICNDE